MSGWGGEGGRWWKVGAGWWLEGGCRAGVAGGEGGRHGEVKQHFLAVYPEHAGKAEVFHNLLDREGICRQARTGEGFSDGYGGQRLLTVGRLTYQKAYDIAIEAMKRLKDAGCRARWYVLGEGDQRRALRQTETNHDN